MRRIGKKTLDRPLRGAAARAVIRAGHTAVVSLALSLAACEDEKPPAPPASAPVAPAKGDAADGDGPARLDPSTDAFVLTFAGERGEFADSSKLDAVPEPSRGMVRVKLLSGPTAPAGTVWVANLKTPDASGTFALSTVPRGDFEELALGQGLSSKVELPEGLEPPEQVAAPSGTVVVYKTAWCGVCKKVESYLKKKGVEYETKDIEKDRSAAAELAAKAKAAGRGWKGSVPVIEIGEELIVGFDRARLEKLLG
ncbi:MAG: glutaredoxin domain-containing protein [Myxococcota bacterium]